MCQYVSLDKRGDREHRNGEKNEWLKTELKFLRDHQIRINN